MIKPYTAIAILLAEVEQRVLGFGGRPGSVRKFMKLNDLNRYAYEVHCEFDRVMWHNVSLTKSVATPNNPHPNSSARRAIRKSQRPSPRVPRRPPPKVPVINPEIPLAILLAEVEQRVLGFGGRPGSVREEFMKLNDLNRQTYENFVELSRQTIGNVFTLHEQVSAFWNELRDVKP